MYLWCVLSEPANVCMTYKDRPMMHIIIFHEEITDNGVIIRAIYLSADYDSLD